MLKVLVLGCNSFIGKHFVRHLSQHHGISLSVYGRSFPASAANVECFQGDFAAAENLEKALKGQDIVYHFISQTVPSSSWDQPQEEVEKNLFPTLKLIELSSELGVKKICFASSGGTVYGFQKNILTEKSPTEPFSPYGIIKRTIESFLQYAKFRNQLNYDIYRISNVYGEGQNIGKGLGFINTALKNIISNRPILIYGNGENIRDYIYIRDLVQLLTLGLTKNIDDSDIYNVSSDHPISLNSLVDLIKDTLQINFETTYLPHRQSDNKMVVLDNSKIMRYFPDLQLIPLAEGIKNTFNYLKTEHNYNEKNI